MKLSTFVLVLGGAFILLMGSCGAIGMSYGQAGGDTAAAASAADAQAPGPPKADVAAPTTRCAVDIRQQGLPTRYTPEGQSRSSHLTPRAENVKRQIEKNFPGYFTEIGGWRPGPDAYSDDHGCGRALDVMVSPIGKRTDAEQKAHGFAIAKWAEDNARVLGVHYIIFQQCIWNVQRADESGCPRVTGMSSKGWRTLEDRGSITQNHYDHVHISVW